MALGTSLLSLIDEEFLVSLHTHNNGVPDDEERVPLKDITYPLATVIIRIDSPFYNWIYRLFSRAITKAWSDSDPFYKDFFNPTTSIIIVLGTCVFNARRRNPETGIRCWNVIQVEGGEGSSTPTHFYMSASAWTYIGVRVTFKEPDMFRICLRRKVNGGPRDDVDDLPFTNTSYPIRARN
ncbi:hypothetical protein CPB84DRAFT_998662 [Gymnopilus junonius]|uniref:Uncharacterized protein n=1 Tax=Gymnopilus junonius TaxID=109634 RepID=A0A9P5NNN6_GYMJU|nr:hypothetical protein CPB84DRAFT_998662 [Gymnopilus junonius]